MFYRRWIERFFSDRSYACRSVRSQRNRPRFDERSHETFQNSRATTFRIVMAAVVLLLENMRFPVTAADWAQFMGSAQHAGNASGESLELPLELTAQIPLQDAVLASPVIVDDRAYVVDQMGTAYAVDLKERSVVWKSAPDGEAACGGNTAAPCVVHGKLYVGTTAGNLHILDGSSARLIRSIALGAPVVSALTSANDSIYLQTIDSVVHCLSREGDPRWRWDHFGLGRAKDNHDANQSNAVSSQTDRKSLPHYSSGTLAVAERKVVAAIGPELVCLDDRGTTVQLMWHHSGNKVSVPMGVAISGGYVYTGRPGSDGAGQVRRNALHDGAFDKDRDTIEDQWAVLSTPAIRGAMTCFSRQAHGVSAYRFGPTHRLWSSFGNAPDSLTPTLASPVLTAHHCVFVTLEGELIAVPLHSRGRGLTALDPPAFRFRTASGRPISSSPAVANGRVVFGSDDGCLYVLGRGSGIQPSAIGPNVTKTHDLAMPAGTRTYGWPSAFGGRHNSSFVDDAGFKPPFELRWAAHSGGLFKNPQCATDQDLIGVSLSGLVVCREQPTGRIRWRRKLSRHAWSRASLLCAAGKVYVPRTESPRYRKLRDPKNALYCLDEQTGAIVWEDRIGIADRLRASPVFSDGVVAFGSLYTAPPGLQTVIPAHTTWQYLAGDDPPDEWTSPEFEAAGWKTGTVGFGYGDDDDATPLDMRGKFQRVYIRHSVPTSLLEDLTELGLMINYDDGVIAYWNGREVVRAGVGMGRGAEASHVAIHEAEGFRYLPFPDWKQLVRPETNVVALEGHNVKLTSSDFTLDAYLVGRTDTGRRYQEGPCIDAWDAQTGRRCWQVRGRGRGTHMEGPAGCCGDDLFFFTGGGSGADGAGETMAIRPKTGEIVWRNQLAYASMNGTPSFQDGKLYLPGVYHLPMACLDAATGKILWQRDESRRRWHVDAASLAPDYFTVNNKYEGGAKRWSLADGRMTGTPESRIELWGPGHGCGSVVLCSEGFALSATNSGLFAIDAHSGRILWQSPAFASKTCPNPIVANGRLFFAPQFQNMLYCFEPQD